MSFGSSDAGAQARAQQEQQQKQIEQATSQINKSFAGFTPQFYNQRAQAYENYALPQYQQQFQDTQNQLGFKLAGQGLSDSSQATQLGEKLGQQGSQAQQQIAQTGIQGAQSLQQQVEQERQNLIGQANAASDPLSVANSAIGTAASFTAPSAFAPVGQFFQNFANTYLAGALNNLYSPNSAYGYGSPYQRGGGGGGVGANLPAVSYGG